MSLVITDHGRRRRRQSVAGSDAAAAAPAVVSDADTDASLPSPPAHATLRTFLDDCLSINVGAKRALERLGDDATELERLARYSMECEERVQTGCLMVQALTLVRYWTLRSNQSMTTANEKTIVEWC